VLPGMAQWYYGRTPHDWHFFFGWLILLFCTLITLGLTASSFLLGATIMCHLASLIDFAILACVERRDRLIIFAIMLISAILLFYVPTSFIWGHLGVMEMSGAAGPLQPGDSLLYRRSFFRTINPRVGDIVFYYAPVVEYVTPRPYQLAGINFDRVLAAEGQTVSWTDGVLTVDGEVPVCQPFTTFSKPPDTTFVVPEEHVYIVPSIAFQVLAVPTQAADWQAMGLVHHERIFGVMWAARRSFFEFVDISGKE